MITHYIQHNPWVADGLTSLFSGLQALAKEGKAVKYQRVAKVFGGGNFVLVASEGTFGGRPIEYYDLYGFITAKLPSTGTFWRPFRHAKTGGPEQARSSKSALDAGDARGIHSSPRLRDFVSSRRGCSSQRSA